MTPTPRRPDPQTVPLLLMTAVTGIVEAASLLGLGHVFTAVMTGNVLFLGFGLAGEDLSVVGSGTAVAAFALGAFGGHRVNLRLVERRGPHWTPVAVAGVAALLLAAALTALGLPRQNGAPTARDLLVIAVLALAMGWRNATTLRLAVPGLPTTVLTRGFTGLFRVHAALDSRERQVAAAVAMTAGAIAGALLLHLRPAVPLLAAAAVELLSAELFRRGAARPAASRGPDGDGDGDDRP
ncbi:YoaK family protein [Kitasatospora sp. NBC_01539]|uniref:YoaK family protein n=1 Tax=Kitasatospora sp. NBC_01539 TaxID=2903577 RepID=UPI003860136B